jgi:hypothetical protein
MIYSCSALLQRMRVSPAAAQPVAMPHAPTCSGTVLVQLNWHTTADSNTCLTTKMLYSVSSSVRRTCRFAWQFQKPASDPESFAYDLCMYKHYRVTPLAATVYIILIWHVLCLWSNRCMLQMHSCFLGRSEPLTGSVLLNTSPSAASCLQASSNRR